MRSTATSRRRGARSPTSSSPGSTGPAAEGILQLRFNTGLFTYGASSQPETAGVGVALVGSFFMMMTVLLLAVPLGVMAAVYLEEFAPATG